MTTGPLPDARAVVDACDALSTLDDSVKALLAGGLVERRFADGAVILSQGQRGEGVFLLAEGTVAVRLRGEGGGAGDDAGDGVRELARLGSGEVFGEMSLITHEPVTADVVADGAVRAFQLGVREFEAIARDHPELGIVLTYLIGDRLGEEATDGLGGKTLDGYRIEQCVGRGAMAVVYRAQEQQGGGAVALKMMSHRLLYQAGAMDRFRSEADIMLSLRHDDIARLHRHFDAFGTCFLAMEYCDGHDLQRVMDTRGALPEAEVRKVVGHLAAALIHLHGRDIAHGDLKPSNVMTTRDGAVKLTDFGLATAACRDGGPPADANADGDADLSASTAAAAEPGGRPKIVGTPIFMAPEQLEGAPPSAATDLYALGCIALELATGHRAFPAGSWSHLLAMKADFELPPARRIGEGVSWSLHRLLKRLLAHDPDERRVKLEKYTDWRDDLAREVEDD